MAVVAFCGQAVVDFIYEVAAMPTDAQKYRALGAHITGGGCAATAAVGAARLGATARMFGRLGADETGDLIARGLEAEGIDCAGLRRFSDGRSSSSAVLVDPSGERMIVNFRDDALPVDADWVDIADAAAVLTDTRWSEGALRVLTQARDRGVPGILDAEAPIDGAVAKAASHVAFSMQGLRDFTGIAEREVALTAAAGVLPGWVAVTDGPDGTFIAGETITHIPAPTVDVVDTLGAGDVWHGAFALALAEHKTEETACRFANAAAALKCTRPGGRDGAPTRAEVETFLEGWTP